MMTFHLAITVMVVAQQHSRISNGICNEHAYTKNSSRFSIVSNFFRQFCWLPETSLNECQQLLKLSIVDRRLLELVISLDRLVIRFADWLSPDAAGCMLTGIPAREETKEC